jgi:hypothetical protein
VLGFDDPFRLQESVFPLRLGRLIGINFLFLQKLARHEIRIAAQQNVGTATGHVGSDRYGAFAACLGHDLSFALVILGVEDVVRHCVALQTTRNQLRILDGDRTDQSRLAPVVTVFDLFDHRIPLFGKGAIDHV